MVGLKDKIAAGKKVTGTMLRIVRNPAIAYLADQAGMDFLMFDCEHSNYSLETIHDISLTANALGIAVMARVPCLREEYIAEMLEAGLEGIQVPMVETAQQAEEIVKYCKYPPKGARGFAAFTANTGYRGVKHIEMMEKANAQTVVIAQIETKLGVENAYEIAAVDGVDILLVGPNDLSISLGIPGDVNNPIELDAISRVADACEANGKLFALHAGPAMCDKFVSRLGLNIQKFDTDFLLEGFKNVRKYTDEKLS
ncbi:HpcH/HpaI aldolase/citrate lyase family protein [uncultured Dysosmobacter sp.]|uniref:HpcH/HpaI aldolase family protein n=1 Tax=uncultured Dysosmobacter sp. TaxID=2591384 RepID=UPI0026047306|nr:aldolase/citrate lyase family protein [uncultured Dysosmobacter sp.]